MDTASAGKWSACAQFPPSPCRYHAVPRRPGGPDVYEHTDNNLGQERIARCIAGSVLRQMIRSNAWPDEPVVLW
ncbi:hypothetical protein ACQP2K_18065 [Microbispora siamensis]